MGEKSCERHKAQGCTSVFLFFILEDAACHYTSPRLLSCKHNSQLEAPMEAEETLFIIRKRQGRMGGEGVLLAGGESPLFTCWQQWKLEEFVPLLLMNTITQQSHSPNHPHHHFLDYSFFSLKWYQVVDRSVLALISAAAPFSTSDLIFSRNASALCFYHKFMRGSRRLTGCTLTCLFFISSHSHCSMQTKDSKLKFS